MTQPKIKKAALDIGTGANEIVALDSSGKLPAVDGSQLLNLPGGGGSPGGSDGTMQFNNVGSFDGIDSVRIYNSESYTGLNFFDTAVSPKPTLLEFGPTTVLLTAISVDDIDGNGPEAFISLASAASGGGIDIHASYAPTSESSAGNITLYAGDNNFGSGVGGNLDLRAGNGGSGTDGTASMTGGIVSLSTASGSLLLGAEGTEITNGIFRASSGNGGFTSGAGVELSNTGIRSYNSNFATFDSLAVEGSTMAITAHSGAMTIECTASQMFIQTGTNMFFSTNGVQRLGIAQAGEWTIAGSAGTAGQILTANSSGTPSWQTPGTAGSISFIWKFDTSTSASDPGNNKFRLNNSTLASVTALYFNDSSTNGYDASTIFSLLSIGERIYVQQQADASRAALFEVSGAATDNGGWWTVPVTVVQSFTLFQNNQNCSATFVLSGSGGGDNSSDPARTVFDESDVCHGYNLTKQGMVIQQGAGGSWKEARVESPMVFWDPRIGQYRMVFLGYSGTPVSPNEAALGYATSDDLTTWTEYVSNPFFGPTHNPGDPDQHGTSGPFVWLENGTYYLFYIGLTLVGLEQGNKTICLATSTDFVTWTRHGSVIVPSGSGWRSDAVWHPSVVKRNGTYYLFFNATDSTPSHETIGFATSTDLLTWTVDDVNSPVLSTGTSGQWDDERVGDPFLWRIRDTWYMSYYGHQVSTDKTQEGYATCPDSTFPLGWTKFSGNPVLHVGSGGTFDDKDAGRTCHFITGQRHYVWYTTDDGSFNIGIASAVDTSLDTTTPTFVGARAYNDTTQSISNNSSTAAQFNQEAFDTDAIHDPSVNNTRFTIPAGMTGMWEFRPKITFAANATGSRFVFLRKNNTGDVNNVPGSTFNGPPNSSEVTIVGGGITVALTAGDYIECIVYQNSGGSLNIGHSSDVGMQNSMEAHFLG